MINPTEHQAVTINLNLNINLDPRTLGHVTRMLQRILDQGANMAATIDQVLADVTEESTTIDSIGTLVSGLKDQLAAALANTTVPPDVQAKIDQTFALIESNKAKLAAAVTANTPAQPPVDPNNPTGPTT